MENISLTTLNSKFTTENEHIFNKYYFCFTLSPLLNDNILLQGCNLRVSPLVYGN